MQQYEYDEKRRLAAAASQFIEDGDCIAIASGTSVLELAKLLRNDLRLNIVTYDLLVALELANRAQFDVLMIGGSIKKAYYSTHRYFAEDMMKKIRVDKAFISADAGDHGVHIRRHWQYYYGRRDRSKHSEKHRGYGYLRDNRLKGTENGYQAHSHGYGWNASEQR